MNFIVLNNGDRRAATELTKVTALGVVIPSSQPQSCLALTMLSKTVS